MTPESDTTMSRDAYMAALVDGEGSISLTARRGDLGRSQLRVTIANTSIALMTWVLGAYGGRYYLCRSSARKKCYQWFCSGGVKRIKEVLVSILPYLVIKKRQAELGLKFIDLYYKKAAPMRQQIAEEMCMLNQGVGCA